MFDIITFGSASQDIYLKSQKFLPVLSKEFATGKGICLSLGSKIEVEDIFFTSGGGGTNTAATFASQGFKVAYCGMLGDDNFGKLIISELKKYGINTSLVKKTEKMPTNIAVLLMPPGGERTILVYRGASDLLEKKDIPWDKIKKTKWVYLAPFSGKLTEITEELVAFAKKNKIRVALNPGYNQLTLPEPILQNILKEIDVLILNREEASLLTKIPYQKEEEIFKKIDQLTPGIAIMTKGREGAVVSDGKYLYRAESLGMKLVDGTGAGDAFGSGFVSGLIQKNDIIYAIQLAMANSNFTITKFGAKEGVLHKNQSWPKIKVFKESCL
ncbi:MAG: carbohydrate kinase family protein [Candidatus Nealsonbacteria bacterium]